MSSASENLRQIASFKELITYLEKELDWPLQQYDFEDLTFEYTPEELGLCEEEIAKIRTIHQLRPIQDNQPWGIFFIEFDRKRLPVVALRRILNRLVIKQRASATNSTRASWEMSDLLFVSSFGAEERSQISFVHFSEDKEGEGLPILRVLEWDTDNTVSRLNHVVGTLKRKLSWPDDPNDTISWRKNWSSAFKLRPREVITTSKLLAIRLADLARDIRENANAVLRSESDKGPWRVMMNSFQKALIHDLKEDDFADMIAQTITYGLLTASISKQDGLVPDSMVDMVPVTNPFLKNLLETFLMMGGRNRKKGKPNTGIDFDELEINEVVQLLRNANMEAVKLDFGDRNPNEDPVIHFFELFLTEYDAEKRMKRGVFYTPRPVVSFIVRSVDEMLRTEFGLKYGLADTTTWGEMVERNKEIQIPKGTSPDQAFVQILDPATGTGTFLVEVINMIYDTLTNKWKDEGKKEQEIENLWNNYVPKHLLPRLHGYELMMAPYAIAHMKIGLELERTGYRFGDDERARIYLTNSLEDGTDQLVLVGILQALAHEAEAVNEIKRFQRFTVIIGNPPYSVTSSNSNPFIDNLMLDYKRHVSGEHGLVALSDDYLKFIRLSQQLLLLTGCGVCGMITNHSYLRGVIHRGVRRELFGMFRSIHILDLHGDSNVGESPPQGQANINVFDIQQGVSIAINSSFDNGKHETVVSHTDYWGTRSDKYALLSEMELSDIKWTQLQPHSPSFFFIPFDETNLDEYSQFPSLTELMPVSSCGIKTHRDSFLIDFNKSGVLARFEDVASEDDLTVLRQRYQVRDTPHWKFKDAQKKIATSDVAPFIREITYRPFDNRWIYYNPLIIEKGDSKYPTLRHMLHENIGLLASRIQAAGACNAIFVTRMLAEMKTAEATRSCTIFPLFLADEDHESSQHSFGLFQRETNLDSSLLRQMAQNLGLTKSDDERLSQGISPEDILSYAYAVFYSPGYRDRYSEFLKNDFPRLPLTSNLSLYRLLVGLGKELVALHLIESPKLNDYITRPDGSGDFHVEKATFSNNTIWIDKAKTHGFRGVPEEVWKFQIGGYQVCAKWLKDRQAKGGKNPRQGRVLTEEDINHYQKIVVAISETIRIMKEIDEVIEEHGGWPDAFVTEADSAI
jgi:predicted helicase